MKGYQRTQSRGEIILKDSTWLRCGSGDRDYGNGTLTL